MTKTRRRFVYHQRSKQDVDRHLQFVGFPETMRHAYGGKLERLHDYLRTFLPADHADTIIDWAKRRLRHDLNKYIPNPERDAEDQIIELVKHKLKYVPRRLGSQSRAYGEYQRQIDWAWAKLAEAGDLYPADPARINNARIKKVVRRGAKRPKA
jgi:hypothetical protein